MDWVHLLSTQRQGQKTGPTESSRSVFEKDFDRIIFSHPFRKLQDKTQVHPLPEHDFVHNRLTHSLEVSSVGRSLGRKAGETIVQRHEDLKKDYTAFDVGAIVASASLAHDVGNPPFGHAGEEALSEFFTQNPSGLFFKDLVSPEAWADLTHFEGNAQGFRILNSNQYGLNLTLATLGAYTKYPRGAGLENRNKERKSQKKFGFFQTEKENFISLSNELRLKPTPEGAWIRHPLAFLVEAADDICYNIIDLEDGCRLGLISFDETVTLLEGILGTRLDKAKLNSKIGLNEKLGVLRAMTIAELIDACSMTFLDHEQDILEGTYDKALTDVCSHQKALSLIEEVSIAKIYRARHVMEIETTGYEVLPGLLQEFALAGKLYLEGGKRGKYRNLIQLLPEEVRYGLDQPQTSMYGMLRLILDFLSSLTDRHALSLFRKLKGISL